jgi:predicted nucleic acid-binding protein
MTYLLDVNVLIALIDPAHIAFDRAHEWFDAIGRHSWATSPMTENDAVHDGVRGLHRIASAFPPA